MGARSTLLLQWTHNRFWGRLLVHRPDVRLKTQAVLSLDDDIYMPCSDLGAHLLKRTISFQDEAEDSWMPAVAVASAQYAP